MSSNKWDFSGWATVPNVRCADGRTIMPGAFDSDDGKRVPLVWNHKHDSPENVIGHALLHSVDGAIRADCSFNRNARAHAAKEAVEHGDITALSIFANNLQQRGGDVYHGVIREVSLVYAGANPGAFINHPIVHSADGIDEDIDYTRAIIFCDAEGLTLRHSDDQDDDSDDFSEEDLTHGLMEMVRDEFEGMTESQKQAVTYMVGLAKRDGNEELMHAADEIDIFDQESLRHAYENMPEGYKTLTNYLVGKAIEQNDTLIHSDDTGDYEDIFESLDDKQKLLFYYVCDEVSHMQHGLLREEDTNMVHNPFELSSPIAEQQYTINLSDAESSAIFDLCKKTSFQQGFLAHAQDGIIADALNQFSSLSHGIVDDNGDEVTSGFANVELLFPEFRNVYDEPTLISRMQEWVSVFLGNVRKVPFAKIRSTHIDITMDEARAKGWAKGQRKLEEVVKVLKRETDMGAVYKKQSLSRQDEIAMASTFKGVAFLWKEMRIMINEEIARAAMIGDGRADTAPDKIDPNRIRPIAFDHSLYNIPVYVTAEATVDKTARAIIRGAVYGQNDYDGSGRKIMFMPQTYLTDMLLMEDDIGRQLYQNKDALATKMLVDKIVPVQLFNNFTHPQTGYKLAGIIVDPHDYTMGNNDGGEITKFEQFDIHYNEKYMLLETFISGALTKPKSAVTIWVKPANGGAAANYTPVTPEGTENPSEEGWYVKSGSTYVLTEDTTVDENATYYTRS